MEKVIVSILYENLHFSMHVIYNCYNVLVLLRVLILKYNSKEYDTGNDIF